MQLMTKRKKGEEGALLAKKKRLLSPNAALQGELCHLVGCCPLTGQSPELVAGGTQNSPEESTKQYREK